MSALLICVTILLYTLQSLFCRLYTEHYPGDKKVAPSVFAFVCGVIVTVVSFICSGFKFEFSFLTVIFGAINAVVLYCYDTFIVKASDAGSYSVLMVFNLSGGIVLPAIFSNLVFKDHLGLVKILCMLTIFAAIYMVSYKPRSESKSSKVSGKFILLCILLGASNGAYGIMLDYQSRTTGVAQKEEMVALTFMGAALISFLVLLLSKKKGALAAFKQTRASLLFLILCSVVSALAINTLVYLLPLVNVTLLYTFDNAGVMMLSAIASMILFKEKLTKINLIGCAVMCLAMICMSLSGTIEGWFLA